MTFLIKLEASLPTGYPLVEENFRMLFPNTSFPSILTPEAVEPFGYGLYDFNGKPPCIWSQKVVEATPTKNANGVWIQTWEVVDLMGDELAAAQTAEQQRIQQEIVSQTQQRLDDFARTRGYDGILSACTYATSPTDKFQTEGQYCVISRDSTWAKLYQILGEVQAGTRPIPSGYADIEPELPPLVWPN